MLKIYRQTKRNKIDDDGSMWLFTKASSYKVEEIETSKKFLLP